MTKRIYMQFIGEVIRVELIGKKGISGYLMNVGNEVLILFDGEDYIYLLTSHIKKIEVLSKDSVDFSEPTESSLVEEDDEMALRKILTSARGSFLEIYITGNQPIHGYITSIMNDYFAFYSPVYKTMLIPLQHLKWVIPYSTHSSPYKLSKERLPVNPSPMSLARSFEVQLVKFTQQLVVFNLGVGEGNIGKIERVEDNIIEIVTAKGESNFVNIGHIQTVHLC